MTPEEKVAKFEEIQSVFWSKARHGGPAVSVLFAALIHDLEIPGPHDEDPSEA